MTPRDDKPARQLDLHLFQFRGETVLLDADLAALYGVSTKRLLEQIRRNPGRFPPDYCFQLSLEEFAILRSQIATSNTGRGGRRYAPWVFAEHGALMAATVLNSGRAVAMSHCVIRAFVRMRRELQTTASLEARLAKIEKSLLSYTQLAPLLAERVVRVQADIERGLYGERPLDESLLLEFHHRIGGDLVPDWAGRWRAIEVRVGNLQPPLPHLVAQRMHDYCLAAPEPPTP